MWFEAEMAGCEDGALRLVRSVKYAISVRMKSVSSIASLARSGQIWAIFFSSVAGSVWSNSNLLLYFVWPFPISYTAYLLGCACSAYTK